MWQWPESHTGFFMATAYRSLRGNEMEKTPFYELAPLSDDPELRTWSINVKIRDGYVCRHCGELDRELLDSHHIKPISQFLELKYDIDNGITHCLWCHAFQGHKDNKAIRDMILARLAIILYLRYVKPTDQKAAPGLFSGNNTRS